MTKTRMTMTTIVKAMGFRFAAWLFGLSVFGFFCILVFHVTFSVPGCSAVLALGLLLGGWTCWRSTEPAARTGVTLLLHSAILFLFFLGISLLGVMLKHRDAVTTWQVVGLLTTVALFWYLRGIAMRRDCSRL
jgi:hypothetical protein